MELLYLLTTTSDCQTPSGEIPDQPEQGIDGCGGKDSKKTKVLRPK